MSAVEVRNLRKRIKGAAVIDDVSFELSKGEIYGIVGDNGSGKSMLIRMMAGLVVPTSGKILYDNRRREKSHSKIGLAIDDMSFYPMLTGFQNLMLLANLSKKASKEDVLYALKRVGLEKAANKKFRKYSLGMKQRLVIAQAIMEKPDVLLLDEPANGIDKKGVSILYRIIKEERERGACVFVSSHIDDDFLQNNAVQIYHMEKGALSEL